MLNVPLECESIPVGSFMQGYNMEKKKRTATSSSLVEKLRDELHEYHVEVTQALATMDANCKHCHKQMADLDLQINGEKPERDDAPSMRHDISSLKQSRNALRRGVQIAWVVITGIGGIVGTMIFKK